MLQPAGKKKSRRNLFIVLGIIVVLLIANPHPDGPIPIEQYFEDTYAFVHIDTVLAGVVEHHLVELTAHHLPGLLALVRFVVPEIERRRLLSLRVHELHAVFPDKRAGFLHRHRLQGAGTLEKRWHAGRDHYRCRPHARIGIHVVSTVHRGRINAVLRCQPRRIGCGALEKRRDRGGDGGMSGTSSARRRTLRRAESRRRRGREPIMRKP